MRYNIFTSISRWNYVCLLLEVFYSKKVGNCFPAFLVLYLYFKCKNFVASLNIFLKIYNTFFLFILIYQKDGDGRLLRLYLDRILSPDTYGIFLTQDKKEIPSIKKKFKKV